VLKASILQTTFAVVSLKESWQNDFQEPFTFISSRPECAVVPAASLIGVS
jgi:hypothetical protein